MALEAILTIAALLLGPVIAVQTQKLIERTQAAKARREGIFKTLMATRGRGLLPAHVEALNKIDLEFGGDRKYAKVIAAWKEYHAQLNDPSIKDEKLAPLWIDKKNKLLVALLHEMGTALDLTFTKLEIERGVYTPVAYSTLDAENQQIRDNLIKILTGKQSLVVDSPPPNEDQKRLLQLMLEQFSGERPLQVRVVADDSRGQKTKDRHE
jgi:hypothetical protein